MRLLFAWALSLTLCAGVVFAVEPGAKRAVHFTLGKDELQFWSPAEKKWVVEPEQFDVWAGGDSNATLHGEFRLTE